MKVTENGTKKSRKHGSDRGCRQRVRAEHEGYDGALTGMRITENNITNADSGVDGLLEQIIAPDNLNRAYKRVKKKGAHGINGMEVEHLLQHLKNNGEELRKTILDGKYRLVPVRRVEISKDNGKKRKLGIPTVVDRVIQQAIQQAIQQVRSPIYDATFSETSYGFRPKRSTHDALRKCKEHADEGYTYVVDMDLEKFFDTVSQSKMIEILSRTVKDGRVISLIHKYLRAGAVVDRKFEETVIGLARGGNLSPLCSNIMLNELDKELERRGIRFVRYADDMILFARTKRSANRILEHILPFIEGKLKLRVNREKTSVAYIGRIKFLGYGFYPVKGGVKLRVHGKSVTRMKNRIREITSRCNGISYEMLKLKLRQYIVGWVNYYKLANMKNLLIQIDKLLRRRLRMFIWKRWKKIKPRYKMLKKLGYNHSNAIKYANTRKGYWQVAGSQILECSITDNLLRRAGYQFFSDYCKTVSA